jgi:hypothetical protein
MNEADKLRAENEQLRALIEAIEEIDPCILEQAKRRIKKRDAQM